MKMCTVTPQQHAIFVSRLVALKDKYRGHRAFMIGNGPSLAQTPLHLLNNEYSFGLNKIAEIYPKTTWRASFYVCVTVAVTDISHGKTATETAKETPSFVGYGNLPYVIEHDKTLRVPEHIYPVWVSSTDWQSDPDPKIWSHDITKRVSKYGSSMLAAMQIAVYMGFNPLIMVGCDLGWKAFDYKEDIDPNHFCDNYWSRMQLGEREDIVVTQEMADYYTAEALSCHILAKKACDARGVKIYNATMGGELEIYPRVDLVDVV